MEAGNMITKEMLLEVAKKKGFVNKDHIEKDYFQDLFLFHLYKKTNILVFKGGTALYKIYTLPRFSEDIDFSILKKTDVESLVSDVANKIGAKIKSMKKMQNSVLIKIGFDGILTSYNTLRMDVSLKNVVFGYDVKYYIPSYIDINPFSLRILNLKEILAEKIHSIFAREKARDLYDLFFLLRFVEPDKKIIEKKLELFDMSFDPNEFQRKINNLKHVWEKELRPFVLADVPPFRVAKDFVLEKSISLGTVEFSS